MFFNKGLLLCEVAWNFGNLALIGREFNLNTKQVLLFQRTSVYTQTLCVICVWLEMLLLHYIFRLITSDILLELPQHAKWSWHSICIFERKIVKTPCSRVKYNFSVCTFLDKTSRLRVVIKYGNYYCILFYLRQITYDSYN